MIECHGHGQRDSACLCDTRDTGESSCPTTTTTMHSTRRPVDPLDRILNEDTREEMHRLMPLIQSRTGPGSGFEIRADRVTGIRPICAFLASERCAHRLLKRESSVTAVVDLVITTSTLRPRARQPVSRPNPSMKH